MTNEWETLTIIYFISLNLPYIIAALSKLFTEIGKKGTVNWNGNYLIFYLELFIHYNQFDF